MKILKLVLGALLAVFAVAVPFLLLFGIAGGIILALNVIPWLLWNHAVAPTFSWPHATFWQVFFICWAASIAGRLLFGSRSK